MKQSLLKKLSFIASAAVLTGALGATAAYAAENNSGSTSDAAAEEKPAAEAKAETNEPEKDETVYVLANANGSTNKVIVTDHLKNAGSSSSLTETSTLKNVENVKGDETFTESGDSRTWSAAGNDIYYQGTSNAELPIGLKVTYFLDGKEVSASDIEGKSGKVKIRFDYTNNKSEDVEINGKTEKIYVPFAAITGLILDNDYFRNIEVTNGKTVNDGDRTVVVGTAFPGLAESLDVTDSEKIDIPDYFEIEADTTGFKMSNSFTIATNELFNGLDIDLGDEESTIAEDIDKLQDAMSQLMDGSEQLHDGLNELLEKSGDLADGVGQLYDGAGQLSDGAAKANDGAAQLYTGSVQLSAGLDELTGNNATLTAGSKQVFQSLLDMANQQLAASGITGYTLTIDNYSATLDKIIASLDKDQVVKQAQDTAKQQVTAAVEANRAKITEEVTKVVRAQVEEKVNAGVKETVSAKVNEAVKATVTEKVTAAVKEKVTAGVLATQNLTPEAYAQAKAAGQINAQTQAAIDAAVEQQMQSAEIKAQIDGAVAQQIQTDEVKQQAAAALEAQMQSDEVKQQAAAALEAQMKSAEVQAIIKQNTDEQVTKLINENLASDEVQAKIKEGLAQAEGGVQKLHDLKTQLDSYNTFYTGLAQYTEGVSAAADGAKQVKNGLNDLSTGTAALADGSKQLYDGISELNGNMPALTEGVTKLADGSGELADGLAQFNEEGITKIIDLVDGDLGNIVDRFRAVKNVSADYETFTGGNGEVKFIYRTESIG